VEEALAVHVVHARDQLVGEHERRLEREPAAAEVEEVLERGPEEVEDHDVVVPLGAVPPDARDARW